MLRVSKITKAFSKATPLFAPVSFELHPGESLQLLGPNGVGKTTLLKMLAGYLMQSEGCVEYLQRSPQPMDTAFMPAHERSFFPKLSLEENMQFFKRFYGVEADHQQWFDQFDLMGFKDQAFQKCSSGIRKRLGLVRALVKGSPILLLDEPFANIDPEGKQVLLKLFFDSDWAQNHILIFSSNWPVENKALKTQSLQVWGSYEV